MDCLCTYCIPSLSFSPRRLSVWPLAITLPLPGHGTLPFPPTYPRKPNTPSLSPPSVGRKLSAFPTIIHVRRCIVAARSLASRTLLAAAALSLCSWPRAHSGPVSTGRRMQILTLSAYALHPASPRSRTRIFKLRWFCSGAVPRRTPPQFKRR